MPRKFIKRKRRWGTGRRASRYAARGRAKRRGAARGRRGKRRQGLPLTGFPRTKMVKLRYVQEIQADPAAAGVYSYYFNATSLFDPNSSGGGHQPLGFDQWATIYAKYTVVGSKIKATFAPTTAAVTVPAYAGIILDDNATFSYTSGPQIYESKQGKQNTKIIGGNANARKVTCTRSYSARKFHGKPPLTNGDIEANVTGNPNDNVYFGVWTGSINGTDPPAMTILIEIEYIAVFSEIKFLAQS